MHDAMTNLGGSDRNNFEEALKTLTRAVEMDPQRAASYNARGYVRLKCVTSLPRFRISRKLFACVRIIPMPITTGRSLDSIWVIGEGPRRTRGKL
jgi:hypothetical protein